MVEDHVGVDSDPAFNFCNRCRQNVAVMNLEEMWEMLSDVPVDADDCIEEDFLFFEKGTDKMHIWHWFDERCPNGLAVDLMGETTKK